MIANEAVRPKADGSHRPDEDNTATATAARTNNADSLQRKIQVIKSAQLNRYSMEERKDIARKYQELVFKGIVSMPLAHPTTKLGLQALMPICQPGRMRQRHG